MDVHAKAPITLLGGARVSTGLLDTAQRLAPGIIAADSGADRALAHGITPRAVIGDFDSISDDTRTRLDATTLHPMLDQDSTDFDKCLRSITAPLILGVGFCGERLDHQMAACNTLVRYPAQRCVLLGEVDLMVLCPPAIHLDLPEGCRVSLFPMGAVEGASDGLAWPIGGLNFAPDGPIGTSNTALGPVHLSVTSPKMLLMLPVSMLDILVTALSESASFWPEAGGAR
ncbi:thiamine diphosphokinase [Roseovarius tibetensis]|uniref:thiamine diphosphokinase n=1 Tax=Roseovarius tibetensis TaxID=2685897 RepID=UPI003D7FD7FC